LRLEGLQVGLISASCGTPLHGLLKFLVHLEEPHFVYVIWFPVVGAHVLQEGCRHFDAVVLDAVCRVESLVVGAVGVDSRPASGVRSIFFSMSIAPDRV
jgi:hypothetical protein